MVRMTPRILAGILIGFALLFPYSVVIERVSGEGCLWFVSVLWAVRFDSQLGLLLEIPLGRTVDFLPFWALSVLVAYLAYLTAKNQDVSQIGYIVMIATVMILQISYIVVLQLIDVGGPSLSYIPVPLVALLALILTPLTIRSHTEASGKVD